MKAEKIIQPLAVMAAGFVATKLLDLVWRRVFGHKPSLDPDSSTVSTREVILFAAVSGAFAAIARVAATRAATRFVGKSLDKARD